MHRFRTAIVTVAVLGATVATGVLATSALATPAPVAAVEAAAPTAPVAEGDATDGTTRPAVRGIRAWWKGLSESQQKCLKDADVDRPVGRLTDAERAALRAEVETAAKACGVELPFPKARAWWNGLTEEQRECVRDNDVTRPFGPLTRAEREQLRADLRAAAEECGIEVPAPKATPTS